MWIFSEEEFPDSQNRLEIWDRNLIATLLENAKFTFDENIPGNLPDTVDLKDDRQYSNTLLTL